MEIIDQHDSVLEEPFPGHDVPGENKQDSDNVKKTDSKETNAETTSSELENENRQPDETKEQAAGENAPQEKSSGTPVSPDGTHSAEAGDNVSADEVREPSSGEDTVRPETSADAADQSKARTKTGEPAAEPESAQPSGDVTAEEPVAEFDYSTLSREDLVSRLKDLLEFQSVQEIITDVDNIKLNFYKKLKLETEQKRKKFVEEGGRIEDFRMPEDPLEKEIKELFRKYLTGKRCQNSGISRRMLSSGF